MRLIYTSLFILALAVSASPTPREDSGLEKRSDLELDSSLLVPKSHPDNDDSAPGSTLQALTANFTVTDFYIGVVPERSEQYVSFTLSLPQGSGPIKCYAWNSTSHNVVNVKPGTLCQDEHTVNWGLVWKFGEAGGSFDVWWQFTGHGALFGTFWIPDGDIQVAQNQGWNWVDVYVGPHDFVVSNTANIAT